MILPASQITVILLLVLAFFCFGLWIRTFRAGSSRFEFFSIDFSLGALALALLAAYTLGTFGSDLTFGDRFLVASHTAQGMDVAAAFLFALGNMLLLAGVSLLGASAAFLLSLGLAMLIGCLLSLSSANLVFLIPGLILALLSSYFAARAAGSRKLAASATASKQPVKGSTRKKGDPVARGLVVTVLSGIALGFVYPLAQRGVTGDFGLAAYAGLVLFCCIMLASTLLMDFFFVRIGIDYKPVTTLGAYFKGKSINHFGGLFGGAIWSVGALAVFLAISAHPRAAVSPSVEMAVPVASVLLVTLGGLFSWNPARGKSALRLSAVFFACALALLSYSLAG